MRKAWLLGIMLSAVIAALALLLIMLPGFIAQKNEASRDEIPESIYHLPLKQVRAQRETIAARLADVSYIDGFPCASGWIHFTQSGQLRAFTLAEDSVIQGNQIPKSTWVQLDQELKLRYCSFPVDTEIQGHLCDGGFGGAEGVSTAFYACLSPKLRNYGESWI